MHLHYKIFWDPNYKGMHEAISESFITPLYQLLFGEEALRMPRRYREIVIGVVDYFPI
jgi:hypothetical protein